MGAMGIILILIIAIGGYYAYTHDNILKMSTITNPIDQFLVKNNTAGSTIIELNDKTYFGKPFSYYLCKNNEDCKIVYGSGTFCQLNQSDSNYGNCYANK